MGAFYFLGGLDICLMLWYFNSAIRQRMRIEIFIFSFFCVWDACHPLAGVD